MIILAWLFWVFFVCMFGGFLCFALFCFLNPTYKQQECFDRLTKSKWCKRCLGKQMQNSNSAHKFSDSSTVSIYLLHLLICSQSSINQQSPYWNKANTSTYTQLRQNQESSNLQICFVFLFQPCKSERATTCCLL